MLELRRRHVFRVAGLYVVGAWVLLQVADLGFESFDISATAMRFVWFALVAFFPLTLVWGWRYDITANGIIRTPPATAGENVDSALRKPDYLILTSLAVMAAVIFAGTVTEIRRIPDSAAQRYALNRTILSSIAVLPLENLSGNKGQNYLAADKRFAASLLWDNLSIVACARDGGIGFGR